jgi:hypothetical protein
MNEFDSFVRQQVKPLAYVRYGDDFVLFCGTSDKAALAKSLSIEKLLQMNLRINEAQDNTIRSWQGLHFLGHVVRRDGSVISRKTKSLMLRRVTLRNISSYSSLKLDSKTNRLLSWLIDICD